MPIKRVKRVIKKLPDKKPYFEAIGALLTIPVLITVLLLNLNNLSPNKKPSVASPTSAPQIIIHDSAGNQLVATPTPNPLTPVATSMPTSATCQKSIGPIIIQYPQEGQTVTDNPVCFIIQHDTNYCSVVWSYKINNGPYSEYTSNPPCIVNLPNGPVEFDLRVQSTVSNDQIFTARRFNYQGNSQPTPTP